MRTSQSLRHRWPFLAALYPWRVVVWLVVGSFLAWLMARSRGGVPRHVEDTTRFTMAWCIACTVLGVGWVASQWRTRRGLPSKRCAPLLWSTPVAVMVVATLFAPAFIGQWIAEDRVRNLAAPAELKAVRKQFEGNSRIIDLHGDEHMLGSVHLPYVPELLEILALCDPKISTNNWTSYTLGNPACRNLQRHASHAMQQNLERLEAPHGLNLRATYVGSRRFVFMACLVVLLACFAACAGTISFTTIAVTTASLWLTLIASGLVCKVLAQSRRTSVSIAADHVWTCCWVICALACAALVAVTIRQRASSRLTDALFAFVHVWPLFAIALQFELFRQHADRRDAFLLSSEWRHIVPSSEHGNVYRILGAQGFIMFGLAPLIGRYRTLPRTE